ncbi:MAG: acyl carrier protein [Elusimicrobia bacterium]|nr:acyl carrier protein [Elusimicrobiota bacterium]
MPDAAFHSKVESVFRKVFDSETLTVKDETTAADVDGWDSLAQVNLIVAAEELFSVRFTTPEIRALKNVGDFKALIARKLEAR